MKKIFLILLSFVVTLNAQWSLVSNPSLLKVDNIDLGNKVVSETPDTSYLSAYILYGYNPAWVYSISGVTVEADTSILSDSERYAFANVVENGNMTITNNGDSSALISNIPEELNTNKTFSNWNYTDLLSGWNFTSGWIAGGGASISSSNTFSTVGAGYISKTFTTNGVYLIRIAGTTTCSSGLEFRLTADLNNKVLYSSFDSTFVLTSNYTTLKLRHSTDGITNINVLEISQLVSPTGWTSSTMDATNYVIENSGCKFVESTGTTYIELTGFVSGHTYRLQGTISSYTSGELNAYNGSTETLLKGSVGPFDINVTMASTTLRLQVDNNSNLTLAELSITEVFTNNSIQFGTNNIEDYKYYDLWFQYNEGQEVFYQSDFSSGIGVWSATRVTATGNNDAVSDGTISYNDVLKFYANSENNYHFISKSVGYQVNDRLYISFWYYIPSSNTNVKKIRLTNGQALTDYLVTLDAWTHYTGYVTATDIVTKRFYMFDGSGNSVFIGADSPTDDVVYLYNIQFSVLDSESQTVETETPIITFDNNQTFTLNPITLAWQDTTLSLKGVVKNDWVEFDGINDYANTSYLGANLDNSVTIEAYAYFKVGSTQRVMLSSGFDVLLGILGTNIFFGQAHNGTANKYVYGNEITEDGWHHLVLKIINNDSLYLYQDGDFVDSELLGGSRRESSGKYIYLGCRNVATDLFFDGNIQITRVWNRSLSDAEILTLYENRNSLTTTTNTTSLVVDYNGNDGNISHLAWTDAVRDYSTTLSGAKTIFNPNVNISLSDTSKMNYKWSLFSSQKELVTNTHSYSRKIITDISTVGLVDNTGTVLTSLGNYDFTVSGEVIPSSNVLQPPTSLDAVLASNSINVGWTDTNIPDTVIPIHYTFDQELDQYLNFYASSGTIITNSADKLKLTRNSATNTWQNAYKSFTEFNSYTEFSFDAILGTSASVWMVVYGYDNTGLHIISNQSSTIDTTFTYAVNCALYDSLKVWVQCNTTANSQYAYFDNFLVRTTTPSYDNWVLVKLDWYLGSTIGEWDILATGTSGTSYQHLGLSNGTKFSYKVAFVLDGDTTAWSDVDTCTFYNTTSTPPVADSFYVVASDYWIRTDGSTNFANATDSSVGVTMDTFFDNLSSVGTNKTASIQTGEHLGERVIDNTDNVNGITFDKWGRGETVITLYDTVSGWSNPANWTLYATLANGAVWQMSGGWSDFDDFAIVRLWLDDKEYKYSVDETDLAATNSYAATFQSSHPMFSYDSVYRWGSGYPDYDQMYSLRVWTPDSSNPALYYTSIKQVSRQATSSDYSFLFRVNNVDNITFRNIVFEGGEFGNMILNDCNAPTFSNCTFRKTQYTSLVCGSSSNGTFINNIFEGDKDLGVITGDTSSIAFDFAAREGLAINFNSDNNIIKGNTFYSYSVWGLGIVANIPVTNFGINWSGTPDGNIADSNYFVNTSRSRYARAYTVHGNESSFPTWQPSTYYASGTRLSYSGSMYEVISNYTSPSTWSTTNLTNLGAATLNPLYTPNNTYITRNYMKDMNVISYLDGAGTTLFMYNIMEMDTNVYDYRIDHMELRTCNDYHILRRGTSTTGGTLIISNNTFVNGQYMAFTNTSTDGFIETIIKVENNLFLNCNQRNIKIADEYNFNSYTTATYDFMIMKTTDGCYINNNYFLRDNITSSDDMFTYRWSLGTEFMGTWDELHTFWLTDSRTNTTANDNTADVSGAAISTFLENFPSDYSIKSTQTKILNSGIDISSYLPAWLTQDRWGNSINASNPNIGGNAK